ncbi:cobalt-precorrin 5A hydrolase [Streptococcus panodentis]|uniref:Cobalt-precorrin 5A hydrolase n=2 Tax=Streptococcus panodentis TaxID=1581472 RepID=A0ABS5AUV4_9STRE|nr:cobalt-precorrin 5A hydrolase [Streptococcus panodentis]
MQIFSMSLDGGRAAMPSDSQARYAIVTVTAVGKELALTLRDKLGKAVPVYTTPRLADDQVKAIEGRAVEAIAQLFQQVDVLICIMAAGAVVRAIAPVLQDKTSDPAVIVMDEKATHVISLLSGHLGGANQVTREIADLLGANPVITTATDVQNVTALDNLAQSVNGWRPDLRPLIKPFNSYLGSGRTVYFYQEKDWVSDLRGLTPVDEEELAAVLKGREPLILLTADKKAIQRENLAVIYPRPYVLGVGARKDVAPAVFRAGFEDFCLQQGISANEIAKIVSIDVKKDEAAIVALAQELGCPFETFSKEELAAVADRYPQSAFVKQAVGVGSVALASADLASQGQVLTERFAKNGCTYALAKAVIKK